MKIGRIGDPLTRAARGRPRALPAAFRTMHVKRIDACGCAMGHGFSRRVANSSSSSEHNNGERFGRDLASRLGHSSRWLASPLNFSFHRCLEETKLPRRTSRFARPALHKCVAGRRSVSCGLVGSLVGVDSYARSSCGTRECLNYCGPQLYRP